MTQEIEIMQDDGKLTSLQIAERLSQIFETEVKAWSNDSSTYVLTFEEQDATNRFENLVQTISDASPSLNMDAMAGNDKTAHFYLFAEPERTLQILADEKERFLNEQAQGQWSAKEIAARASGSQRKR